MMWWWCWWWGWSCSSAVWPMKLHHGNVTLAQRGNSHSYHVYMEIFPPSLMKNCLFGFVWSCHFLCLMCLGFYKDCLFLNDGHKHCEMQDILLPSLNFMHKVFLYLFMNQFFLWNHLFIADLSVDYWICYWTLCIRKCAVYPPVPNLLNTLGEKIWVWLCVLCGIKTVSAFDALYHRLLNSDRAI